MAGEWNVPAGTKTKLKVHNNWNVVAGAIEHKNRPEAIYITMSSWVKPKLHVSKSQANSIQDPVELNTKLALDFDAEVKKSARYFASYFDSKYFDPNSIIWTFDYAPRSAKVGQRQFIEIEINIDTVNTIDMEDQPSPNPGTGKIEMYSFKDLERPIIEATKAILTRLEVFDAYKGIVTFATSKGAK